jgi:hypothetical protein
LCLSASCTKNTMKKPKPAAVTGYRKLNLLLNILNKAFS